MGAREMHCAPAWADGGCADLNARLLEDWRTDCMHGQSATARIYGSNMCILHKIASRIHIDEGGAQMPSTALPRIRSAGGSRQLPSRRRENTGIRSTTAVGISPSQPASHQKEFSVILLIGVRAACDRGAKPSCQGESDTHS
jgi:hypothetical protein